MILDTLVATCQAESAPKRPETQETGGLPDGRDRPPQKSRSGCLKLFFAAPTNPTVPRRTAEGARLPARSAHPPPAPREHVAQTSTRKLLETKIMMMVHHTVPATHIIRPRQAHHHIPERKTLRSRLEKIRGAFHDHHGYHAASQTASTNPNPPEPAEPSLPTNLAWDGRAAAPSRAGRRQAHLTAPLQIFQNRPATALAPATPRIGQVKLPTDPSSRGATTDRRLPRQKRLQPDQVRRLLQDAVHGFQGQHGTHRRGSEARG